MPVNPNVNDEMEPFTERTYVAKLLPSSSPVNRLVRRRQGNARRKHEELEYSLGGSSESHSPQPQIR